MTELKALLRKHARATIKEFYEKGKVGPAIWLLENEFGSMVMMTPMPGEEMAKVGRDAIREFGAVRYAVAFETWFLLPDEHEGLDMRPSESPHRHEGIWISAEDKQGNRACMTYEIHRAESGKPYLTKMKHKTIDFSGRLADMFAIGPYT